MPLYALPLTAASHPAGATAAVRFQLPTRKRKRSRDSSSSSSDDVDERDALRSQESSLPAALTNPLSLAPDEVMQYRLAGLDLDEQLPSTTVKDFPHRGLPEDPPFRPPKGEGKDKWKLKSRSRSEDAVEHDLDSDDDYGNDGPRPMLIPDDSGRRAMGRATMLRIQHISVLTAIVQRCLQEKDIPRASRAWALLIRAEVGGKGIDLRGSGYWGIGAELLIRFQEKNARRKEDRDSNDEGGGEEGRNGMESREVEGLVDESQGSTRRWGSAEGLEKAKDYYERLILQHPYKRQFPNSVSALDFWPAMVGCEIYGIQYEQQEALRKLALSYDIQHENDSSGSENSSERGEAYQDGDENDIATAQTRRRNHQDAKRAEESWRRREEIRTTALTASDNIAIRLDALMTTPPYSDSHALLRLRGMLALYIGDLSVPAAPTEQGSELGGLKNEGNDERRGRLGSGGEDSKRRLLSRQRMQEHERGKEQRLKERARATNLFEKIKAAGGRFDFDFRSLGGDEIDEDKAIEDVEDDLYGMEE